MRIAQPTDKLKVGQTIYIKRDVNNYYRPNPNMLVGTVLSANHYGNDGWYIELDSKEFGYGYWKQGSDGGELYVED